MRIIKFLLGSVATLGVVAVLGFFLGREVLLFWGISTVKSSLSELESISVNYGNYVQTCRQKGAPMDQIAVAGLQLRFINDQEYLLEIICNGIQFDPIVILDKKLPPLVTKEPGAGGVIWGSDLSSVALTVLGRRQVIGVQNKSVVNLGRAVATGVSPLTTCQGRGYVCCTSDAQFGTGQLQDQVNDCPKSCYATCLPRPIVLSFSSDPILDQQTRTVTIGPNQTVSFAYVVSYDNKVLPTITLDYGDGQTEVLKKLTGQTSHLYTCNVGTCKYQVNIAVSTPEQISSVQNTISQLTVAVQPQ